MIINNLHANICRLMYTEEVFMTYTRRENIITLHFERFLSLLEYFACALHDLTCMIIFVTVQDIEPTVQGVETNLTSFSY